MLNNGGKGLYHIGEQQRLPCGCVIVAEEQGYTHYINPDCTRDNIPHPVITHYHYKLDSPPELNR